MAQGISGYMSYENFNFLYRKSTIFRLLYRFYDPEQGSVCIDGEDLKNLQIDSIRKAIGVIPQVSIFSRQFLFEN